MIEQLHQAEQSSPVVAEATRSASDSSSVCKQNAETYSSLFSIHEANSRLARGLDRQETQVKNPELGLLSSELTFDGSAHMHYDPTERPADRLKEFSRSGVIGGTEIKSSYEGRKDGLLEDKKVVKTDIREHEQKFDSSVRLDGKLNSHHLKTTDGTVDLQFNNYDGQKNATGLAHETISKENGVTKTTRSYVQSDRNRQGLLSETSVEDKAGRSTVSKFADGRRTETYVSSDGKEAATKNYDKDGTLIGPEKSKDASPQTNPARTLTNDSAEQNFKPRTVEEMHLDQFREALQASNFELAPMKKGWGPYQALHQAAKEQGMKFSSQQLLDESVRIRNRELADPERKGFELGERLPFLSSLEIDRAVEIERIRIGKN